MGLYIGSDYVEGVSIYKGGIRQSKNVAPLVTQQTIYPDAEYDSLQSVTISAVTSAIDSNITAENIKEGVSILGVTGSLQSGSAPVSYRMPFDTQQNPNGVTSTLTINVTFQQSGCAARLYYTDGNYESQYVDLQSGTNTITNILCMQYALLECTEYYPAQGPQISNTVDVFAVRLYGIEDWASLGIPVVISPNNNSFWGSYYFIGLGGYQIVTSGEIVPTYSFSLNVRS